MKTDADTHKPELIISARYHKINCAHYSTKIMNAELERYTSNKKNAVHYNLFSFIVLLETKEQWKE